MSQALNISQITAIKNLIHKDLVAIASLVTFDELVKLGIPVLTGIENKDTTFQYLSNQSIARPYAPGKHLNAELGVASERVLQVKNVWTRIKDNIQNYREKEGIDILGVSENGVLEASHTQFIMQEMAKVFANQNALNVFHGKRDDTTKPAYSLFDGFFTHVDNDTNTFSAGNGNLQALTTFTFDGSQAAKVQAYDNFDEFMLNMDEDLADAETLNIAVSRQLYNYITQGAAFKFGSQVQSVVMQTNNGTSFFDRTNVRLIPSRLLGQGQTMVAYRPGALEVGSDMTRIGDPASAFINISQSNEDANEIIYQMQVALGTRITFPDSGHFCIGLNKAGQSNAPKDLSTSEGVQAKSGDNGERIADLENA